MPAHTHPRSSHPAAGGVDFRLPWWGFVLPAIAFGVLLALIIGSGDTQAVSADGTLAHLVDRIQQTLSH
ncbi:MULTISPECIES: hypothetical protein [unclassified Streptomyces]|uniref:hypothetical protein n=1 Tax=unclassified Streptomyces TaxID=2593676 RepID=UPI0038186290